MGCGPDHELVSGDNVHDATVDMAVMQELGSQPPMKEEIEGPEEPWRYTICRQRCCHPVILGMGLWTLLEGLLLVANALAVLNEDRFLAPRGWSICQVSGGDRAKSLKGQLSGFIYATQYFRMPLIALNMVFIVVKLVSG